MQTKLKQTLAHFFLMLAIWGITLAFHQVLALLNSVLFSTLANHVLTLIMTCLLSLSQPLFTASILLIIFGFTHFKLWQE